LRKRADCGKRRGRFGSVSELMRRLRRQADQDLERALSSAATGLEPQAREVSPFQGGRVFNALHMCLYVSNVY
jgi:hypothetical protein